MLDFQNVRLAQVALARNHIHPMTHIGHGVRRVPEGRVRKVGLENGMRVYVVEVPRGRSPRQVVAARKEGRTCFQRQAMFCATRPGMIEPAIVLHFP